MNPNSHRYKSTVNLCSSASICGSNGHSRYDVNGYALACWRPTLVALDFARRFNRDSHAARTLGMGIECGSSMNWHVNSVSNVARRRTMIPDRNSAVSARCTCHVARTVVTCERNYVSSGSDRAEKSPRDESQNHKSQRIANANKAFNQSGGGSGFEIDTLPPPPG